MNQTVARINSLLLRLQIADRQNRQRGAEGMVARLTEQAQLLEELYALSPLFRKRLILAEMKLAGAKSMASNQ